MIARSAWTISIALLAAAPALAQKPAPEDLDPRRAQYRDRALAACVAELGGAEGISAEASESTCGCAAGRFMPRWPTGALPPLESGRPPSAMLSDIVGCAGDAALAAAVAQRLAQRAMASVPPVIPVAPDKPLAAPEPAPSAGFDSGAWLEDLSLPSWLSDSGLPIWVLVPMGVLVLLFLRGLFRRSEDKDLLGPPRSSGPPRRP
jgi:hypothetical protein